MQSSPACECWTRVLSSLGSLHSGLPSDNTSTDFRSVKRRVPPDTTSTEMWKLDISVEKWK